MKDPTARAEAPLNPNAMPASMVGDMSNTNAPVAQTQTTAAATAKPLSSAPLTGGVTALNKPIYTGKKPVWKAVVGFEDLYEVSDTGLLRNIKTSKEYKRPRTNKPWKVKLRKDGNTYDRNVARLVCEAFNGSPKTSRTPVVHIDKNYSNRCASNLKWKGK